jgi:predicted methyltransferase MtxX (methanogen marker protein 4)
MALPLYDEWCRILAAANTRKKMVIGVGLNDSAKVTPNDLAEARSLAELIIVGNRDEGHEGILSDRPEHKLVEMLKNEQIHGIVKVDCGGVKLRNAYREAYDLPHVNRGCLVSFDAKKPNSEERVERSAMIFPVSPEEGATREDRLYGIHEAVKELRIFTNKPIHVGLLSLCRVSTAKNWTYDAESRSSYEDACWIAENLKDSNSGVTAKNYNIALEDALQESDIISHFRGSYGGLLYRTLAFIGTAREIASPSFTRLPYVGGTNNLGNLAMRVKYAVAKWNLKTD